MILWKCIECDEINTYPQDTVCQTCGESMTPGQKESMKRVEFLIKRAESGDLYAAIDLFKLYQKGEKVLKNKSEALKWIKYAAERENGKAQYELGKLYFFENDLVELNDAEAFQWFTKSMKNNYPFATHYVAQCYSVGAGVQEDEKKGFELFLENAKQGIPESMERVAMFYKYGIGVQANDEKALYWLNRATEIDGYELTPKSAYRLGCYLFDEDVREKKQESRALHYLEIAYKNGIQMAGCLIGELFYSYGHPTTTQAAKNIWTQVSKCTDEEAAERAQYFLNTKSF